MTKLLTVRELAERLAVPERTIYRLAGEGLPGSYRVRRAWRFDLPRVLEALRSDDGAEDRVVDLDYTRARRKRAEK